MASTHPANVPAPGFAVLGERSGRNLWRPLVGFALMGAGLAALAWGFLLMLGRTNVELPSQTPVALQHPLELLGALGLSLLLLCAGAVVLGRGSKPAKPSQDS